MKKIFGLFKKHIITMIFVVILLVVQVFLDLKIPEYASQVVNIGIQQNGIKDTVPNVIRESALNLTIQFLTVEESEKVLSKYHLITKDDQSYNEYTKKLSDEARTNVLKYENLYVLNDINDKERKELDHLLSNPLLFTYFLTSEQEQIVKIRKELFASNQNTNQDGMSFIAIKKNFEEKINEYEPELINQMKPAVIIYEYQIIGYDMQPIQTKYILETGGIMLSIALAVMIITVMITYFSARLGTGFSKDLREAVTKKVMSFSNKEFEEIGVASLITRSTNDIQRVQMLIVMGFRMILYAPILGLGAYTKINTSPMAWVIGVAILFIFILVLVLLIVALPKFNSIQKLIDKLNLVSREILTGLPVIRAFATEKEEEARFDKANLTLTKTNLFVNRVMTIMMPTMMIIMNGVSILIVWIGSKYVDTGALQVGTLMAFISYTMQIIMAFLMLTMISVMLPRGIVSLKRIANILKMQNSVKDKVNPLHFPKVLKGDIEFKDVYFRYPDADEDVLQNINFNIKSGTTTAFIGSTGSGKSTVINLLPRFFDVTSGKILIDGIDIQDVSLNELRSVLGFVPQKGVLFTGTIKDNIAFGKNKISDKEIINAANIAQASSFIKSFEDQYDYEIAQGGTNVSGGQKQRLAIARAIAKDPKILIFDDSFSALDFKTDANLRKALKNNLKDKTVLIVASRIATIMDADQIVVLNEGEIVGIGNHKELLKNNEVYKEIATSQLSEEELNI